MTSITDRIRAVMRTGCTHEQLLGDVIAEIERLQADAAYWREEARRYAGNADYWRERFDAAIKVE